LKNGLAIQLNAKRMPGDKAGECKESFDMSAMMPLDDERSMHVGGQLDVDFT